MIEITPTTEDDSEVHKGDTVRVSWLLDVSADPEDITFTETLLSGEETTYSGDDIDEEEVQIGSDRFWRYSVTLKLRSLRTRFEYVLSDPVNDFRDTAEIIAQL